MLALDEFRTPDAVASLAWKAGLTRVIEALPKRDCLLVLNYHRVGNRMECVHSRNVFSATAQQFEEHVRYLKRSFSVATLAEAQWMLREPGRLRGFHVLLTFDDGYRDNFEIVYPILRAHGVQGTFFLPTAFVGTGEMPWWDRLAGLVRSSERNFLELTVGGRRRIQLSGRPRELAIADVARLFDAHGHQAPNRFINELADACGVPLSAIESQRLFMTWSEAAAMVRGGMAVGSHTHDHPTMSQMPVEQQVAQLRRSGEIMSTQLGFEPTAFAYPYGARETFTAETAALLRQSGYEVAFSCYGGINVPKTLNRFDVQRIPIGIDLSMSWMRLRNALIAAFALRQAHRSLCFAATTLAALI